MKLCKKCGCDDESKFGKANYICNKCRSVEAKEYRLKNSEKINERRREVYLDRSETILSANRKYQDANRDKVRKINRDYYASDPTRRRSYQQTRRTRVKLQTPNWLVKQDFDKMEMLYTISRFITNKTGIKMAVDHIVPLNGKTVSGFNMPENMQVITKLANEQKGNSYA